MLPVAAVVALGLSSCSDQLGELPSQYKVDGNVVVDQSSAEILLNGMYYTYAQAKRDNYDNMSTGCALTYTVLPANMAGLLEYYQGAYILEEHGSSTYTMYSSYFWSGIFGTMNAANSVIEQIEAANDDWFKDGRKEEMLGEAYAMRALSLYDQLRLYGYSWDTTSRYGCIVRTKASKTSNMTQPRSSVADTYTQIISDLDYAIANAPAENEHYYITKWFAKGLKARVLMLRGEGSDYADAAELAADVINNGPYSLEENVTDIFQSAGMDSPEVIFGIQPYDSQVNVYEQLWYRGSAQYLATDNFEALFDGDPRKDQVIKVKTGSSIQWNDDGTYSFVEIPLNGIGKFFADGSEEATTTEETQYNMRLTEMYLLRAEALVRSGGSLDEARSLLKTVLQHAGYTDFTAVDNATTSDALLTQIFNEDLRNLCFECGRELDFMLRFGSIATAFNSEYENQQYNVFPLPTDEFLYNGALTADDQNPGYSAE